MRTETVWWHGGAVIWVALVMGFFAVFFGFMQGPRPNAPLDRETPTLR